MPRRGPRSIAVIIRGSGDGAGRGLAGLRTAVGLVGDTAPQVFLVGAARSLARSPEGSLAADCVAVLREAGVVVSPAVDEGWLRRAMECDLLQVFWS